MSKSKLLIEFYSGEIPPRFQKSASEKIKNLLDKYLHEESVKFISFSYYSTHRIIIYLENIDRILPNILIEKKGPAVNSPKENIENFARVNGVSLSQLKVKLIKNTEYYFLIEEKQNSDIKSILSISLKKILEEFHWPKSMRWHDYHIRWIRPLHNILFLLDDEILEIAYGHLISNNQTIINYKKTACRNVEEYFQILKANNIIFDPTKRQQKILDDISKITTIEKCHFKEDVDLLEELSGITEKPIVKMGKIDEEFMSLPPEVLNIVMKHHQKYFSTYDFQGQIRNRFLFVSVDKPTADYEKIIENNEQVLRNRLKDAEFFYQADHKKSLDEMVISLKDLTYHNQLGNYYEKTQRIIKISEFLAIKILPNKIEEIKEAARKCKFDLVTNMVNELPELQGIMGYYYILNSNGSEEVASMVRDHYLPVNLGDNIPRGGAAIISIADKLDSIICMFAIGQKPTGSKDPYAVRRSAVGIIKTLIENHYFLNLRDLLNYLAESYRNNSLFMGKEILVNEIKDFFIERFFYLSKQNFSDHLLKLTVINSEDFDVFASHKKLSTLQGFLQEDNEILLESLKRIYNISVLSYNETEFFAPNLLKQETEINLYQVFSQIESDFLESLGNKDFELSLKILKKLDLPIKKFMDEVTIKSDDIILTNNRLNLISKIKKLTMLLLDFSKI